MPASVYQERGSGRWVAALVMGREDGRPIRRKVTAATEAEVRSKLADLEARVAVAPQHDGAVTVGQWLDTWLDEVGRTKSRGTATVYRDVVSLYVRPHVGHLRLAQLRAADVDRMLKRLHEKGLSANTQKNARAVLRRALTVAVRREMIPTNYALGQYVEGPSVTGAARKGRAFAPAERRLPLGRRVRHRWGAAVIVQLVAGLRPGEVLGLRWEDVRSDFGVLVIDGALKRGGRREGTKSHRGRTVEVPPAVFELLASRRGAQQVEAQVAGEQWSNGLDLVFTTLNGSPIDHANYRHAVAGIAKRAGLGHLSPHALRHAGASAMLATTGDIKLVSETLGHSSIRVTADVYGHLLAGATGKATSAVWDQMMGARQ